MKKMFTAIVVIMMVALAFTVVASAAENYTANDAGLYEISVDSSVIGTVDEGTQYGMVVVEATGDEAFALNQATIRYIDQTGVASGTITFEAFAPMDLVSNGTYKVYIGGGDLTEATYIGTLKTEEAVPTLTSITLNPTAATLKVGEEVTITATANDGLTPTYTWETSAPGVATVEDGVVTAVGEGTATITVSSGSVTATATITVEKEATTILYGDVNNDGGVKNSDVLLLKKYVARWNDITINEDAADVNLDGGIKNSDVLILKKNIARWDGFTTLPIPSK